MRPAWRSYSRKSGARGIELLTGPEEQLGTRYALVTGRAVQPARLEAGGSDSRFKLTVRGSTTPLCNPKVASMPMWVSTSAMEMPDVVHPVDPRLSNTPVNLPGWSVASSCPPSRVRLGGGTLAPGLFTPAGYGQSR